MSLIPYYLYEEGTELPEEGNYYIIARNGVFIHKNCRHTRGIVKVDFKTLPFIRDLEPPKKEAVPIYVCDDDCGDLPRQGNYFVLAKNGIFEHKDYSNYDKFVRGDFKDLKFLGEIQTRVHFELPKIPVDVSFKVLTFFRRVWHQYHSEAAIILYYNWDQKCYYIRCPKQSVTGAGVQYGQIDGENDPDEIAFESAMRKKGFERVGTIHSHCDFSAYHSSVDTGDEAEWPDGVHITFGHVNQDRFSIASSLVMNDNRFTVDAESVLQGLRHGKSMGFRQSEFYSLELTEEQEEKYIDQWHTELEQEWMPRVKQGYYSKNKGPYVGGSSSSSMTNYNPSTPPPTIFERPRVCPHCSAVNLAEVASAYKCRECQYFVAAYEGYISDAYDYAEDVEISLENDKYDAEEISFKDGDFSLPGEALVLPPQPNEPEPTIERKSDLPDSHFLGQVRSHASALLNHAGHIPTERLNELLSTLKKFYNKQRITDEDILAASKIDPKNPGHYQQKESHEEEVKS